MPQEVKQDRMRENTKRVADQKYKNANVIKKKKLPFIPIFYQIFYRHSIIGLNVLIQYFTESSLICHFIVAWLFHL